MNKIHGNIKSGYSRFSNNPKVKKILGNYQVTEIQKNRIDEFFRKYQDAKRPDTWNEHIAFWIVNGIIDWDDRRLGLLNCAPNSLSWFRLRYGDELGNFL